MYLYGENITLRAIEEEDLNFLRDLINDPDIQRLTLGWNYPISEYQQKKWFYNLKENKNCVRWIVDVNNDQVAGMCTLSDIDWKNRVAKIGIKLRKDKKSRGLGTESYKLVVRYAFEELQLNRIEAEVIEYNEASIALHKRMAFKEEGRKRKCIYQKGRYYDTIIFALLKQDYI